MTSEEQAREIARHHIRKGPFADEQVEELTAAIVKALRLREAETWEQAAQEVREHAKACRSVNNLIGAHALDYAAIDLHGRSARARAAQPQETKG